MVWRLGVWVKINDRLFSMERPSPSSSKKIPTLRRFLCFAICGEGYHWLLNFFMISSIIFPQHSKICLITCLIWQALANQYFPLQSIVFCFSSRAWLYPCEVIKLVIISNLRACLCANHNIPIESWLVCQSFHSLHVKHTIFPTVLLKVATNFYLDALIQQNFSKWWLVCIKL